MLFDEETLGPAMAERKRRNERRAFRRWPVAIPAQCYGFWGSSQATITEINEAGLNLEWEHQADPGQEVTIAWRVDDGPPLQITCAVRYAVDHGAGVEFLDARITDRLRILAFLNEMLKS